MFEAYVKCKICGGKKLIPVTEPVGMNQTIEMLKPCPYCNGKGEILKAKIDNSMRRVIKQNRAEL